MKFGNTREAPKGLADIVDLQGSLGSLAVSRAAAFTLGWAAHPARVPAATRCLTPGCAPVSSPAIGHMVRGGDKAGRWIVGGVLTRAV